MKTAEKLPARVAPVIGASTPLISAKILPSHLERLAIVYVRQSTQKQVLENRESSARQYAFAERAVAFGWPRDRVLVIDEDLGKSGRTAEGRSGFQRLVTEVTLNHVGLVLGLEMSRLARSSKDWHAFFEMCAIFGTLIADEDGVYDGNDANDRLLLGLKGIMSEMELHIMRNRLERGRDHKASRGELFHSVPMGYVILPSGEVDFEPDEQARNVVQIVFEKFDEIGSIYGLFHWLIQHDVQMPVRARTGAKKGQLEWHRPSVSALAQVLRHPIYAGAYSYGRRPTDRKRKFSPGNSYRPWVAMEQWKVLIKDHLPAYISWDQFLKNRERIKQNQNASDTTGVPRAGAALLTGILVCGQCGRHMQPSYPRGGAHYACNRYYLEATERRCYGLSAPPRRARGATGPARVGTRRAGVESESRRRCGARAATPANPLGATPATRALRRRTGRAALSSRRSRESVGGGQPGKTVGRTTGSATAASRGLRSFHAGNAAAVHRRATGARHRARVRHSRAVARGGHEQC